MIIAIDFDGTIVNNKFPEIGEPIGNAFDALLAMKRSGYKLILWTCRNDIAERNYLTEAVDFCRDRGLEFDAINDNLSDSPFAHLGNGRKVYADLYIDDKSLLPVWETFN